MARLALFTFGVLNAPRESHAMQTFLNETVPSVFETATVIDGFIARSGFGGERSGLASWGERAVPRFLDNDKHAGHLQTLSLWKDVESASTFAYHGSHGDALKRRTDWFVKPEWPTMVTWWVADDQTPTWLEAATNLEALADNGPTAQAFDLAHPFDADGNPATIDRELVREKRAAAGI